ncbi:MAG: IS21 family transposase, partial [Proteobacteria bacterium]|nr:IS21 family transposase [Pseudomonadota bacterium]
PPRPPAVPNQAVSACEPVRGYIEQELGKGRNAKAIYQDLVDEHGFTHGYNSVKRFARTLRSREPERFDVLDALPGEECQVDYGLGALTRKPNGDGKYSRPYLFVMTLKNSDKSFRKCVWKTSQETWSRLHEEAWRSFGGSTKYVVLDNLKEGVIAPDLYQPKLNPVYAAMLEHYGVVADPCRVRDPNRKGTVENAVKHTQNTALKGKRFETIEEQNAYLANWEERWAATRIHGRKKRQVMEMYLEERPHLQRLPVETFRYFREVVRTVDSAGMVQVDSAYYAAMPARLYSEVKVRVFDRSIEVLAADGSLLRRHEKSERKGSMTFEPGDRIFNPSRESARLLARMAQVGPHTAELGQILFRTQGRHGHRLLYGLANLPKSYHREDIEAVAKEALASGHRSYPGIKRALDLRTVAREAAAPQLKQSGDEIRQLSEYSAFFDHNTHHSPETDA